MVFALFFLSFSFPRRNSDWDTRSGLFSPLPTTARAFAYREKIPASSSLADSRRIVAAHAANALSGYSFLFIFLAINSKVRPTWDSNPKTDSSNILG